MIEMKSHLRTLLAGSFASLLTLSGCNAIFGGNAVGPGTFGARPTGFVYTTLYAKNAVLEINTVQSRVDHEPITVPNGPRGLTIDPRDRNLYLYVVCELGDTVAVVDRRNRLINRTINVGRRPYAMAINSTGTRGFVSNTDEDTVSIIDINSNTVIQTLALGNPSTNTGVQPGTQPGQQQSQARLRPRGIATNANGSTVYVACEGGYVAILQGNPPTSTTPTSGGVGPTTGAGYSVARLVPLIGSVQPLNITVSSNGTAETVYITDPQANRLFFFNGANAVQAEVRDVPGRPFDVAVARNTAGNPDAVYVSLEARDALQAFTPNDMAPRGEAVRVEGRQPQAVEVSTLGNEVYVSLSGSNNVALFERRGADLLLPQVFNLQQLNPAFIAPTGDLALGGFLFQ